MPEMTFGQMREAAAGQGFEPHPEGEYLFKVETAEIKEGKGSNQIMIRLVNQNGPHANKSVLNRLAPKKNDGDVNGMFFQQLKALGFGDQDPIYAQMDQYGLDQALLILTQQLPGRMAICVITHDNWGGETRDNVKRMKPYTGAAPGAPPVGGAVPAPIAQSPQPPSPAAVQPISAAPPTPVAPMPTAPAPVAPVAPVAPPMAPQAPVAAPVAPAPVEQQQQVAYGPVDQPVAAPAAPAPQQGMEAVTAPVVPLPQPNVPTPPENPF